MLLEITSESTPKYGNGGKVVFPQTKCWRGIGYFSEPKVTSNANLQFEHSSIGSELSLPWKKTENKLEAEFRWNKSCFSSNTNHSDDNNHIEQCFSWQKWIETDCCVPWYLNQRLRGDANNRISSMLNYHRELNSAGFCQKYSTKRENWSADTILWLTISGKRE